jgi:hypothetical protein
LKDGKKHRYVIYKLSDDATHFVVEETSNGKASMEDAEKEWLEFREKLLNAKSAIKVCEHSEGHSSCLTGWMVLTGLPWFLLLLIGLGFVQRLIISKQGPEGDGPRCAVYDFEYNSTEGYRYEVFL